MVSHFKGEKMEAQATEVTFWKLQRFWSVCWGLSSALGGLCSLSGPASRNCLCEFGEAMQYLGCFLYGPSGTTSAIPCHTLCPGSKDPFLCTLAFSCCQGTVGAFVFHVPLGHVMVLSCLCSSGVAMALSMTAGLAAFQSYCILLPL